MKEQGQRERDLRRAFQLGWEYHEKTTFRPDLDSARELQEVERKFNELLEKEQ